MTHVRRHRSARARVRNSIAAVVITALATIGCQPNDDRETTDTGLAAGRSSVSAASSAPGTDPGDAPLVFVSNEDSDDITIIDSGTDSVIATVRAGKRPRGLRLSPDGTTLFVAVSGSPKAGPGVDESKLPPPDRSADGVAVIDVATRRYVKTLPGGNDPESFDVSLDGKTVYVSNEDNGTASILDVESGTVIGTVPVGEEPEGVTLRPDGKAVYVTSEATGTVAVVDTDSRKVIATIATGERPRSIVFTPDGSKAYVTAEVAGAVAVIDARTNRPLERIVVPDSGAKPMGTAISPDGKWVYVTNGRGRTLSIIDTASDSIVASIRVGTRPWGVAVTPDGKKIYTANGPSNDVSVIDAESRRVIKTIPAGRSPWGIAIEQR